MVTRYYRWQIVCEETYTGLLSYPIKRILSGVWRREE